MGRDVGPERTRLFDDSSRISAMRSSIAYHAREPKPTLRTHPIRSAGRIYACACKWSVTGILMSRKGGVMKPMRKDGAGFGGAALFDMLSETEDDTSSSGDVDVGASGSCRDESSRWETSRTEASNGRSLGVRAYKDGTCKLKATIMWPKLETGFAVSLYAVKFSSLQMICGEAAESTEG